MPLPLAAPCAAAPPSYSPPRAADDDAAMLAGAVADLRRRLARACAGLPAADFDALVDRMARRALRWAARG